MSVWKITPRRGFVRSQSVPFVHDNLGETIKKYDPESWYAKRCAARNAKYFFRDPIPESVEFKVEVYPEDFPDWSWCGEFSDRWQEGAIVHSRNNSREYKYFIPAETAQELRATFSRLGYSRQVAWETAQEIVRLNYKTMLNEEQWVVKVTALLGEKEIGEQYLGSVFLDTRGRVPEDIVEDMNYELFSTHQDVFQPEYAYA